MWNYMSVFTVLIWTTTATDTRLREKCPLGILACRFICKHSGQCYTILYDTSTLKCLYGNSASSDHVDNLHVLKTTVDQNSKKCSPNSLILQTRSGIISCIIVETRPFKPKRPRLTRKDPGLSKSSAILCERMIRDCNDDYLKGALRYLSRLSTNMEKSQPAWYRSNKALHRFVKKLPCDLAPYVGGVLHGAACFGFLDVIRCMILKTDVDVNAVDSTGYTALMFAARKGFVESFRLILRAGGSLNMRVDDRSMLDLAKDGQNSEIIDLVKKSLDAGGSSKPKRPRLTRKDLGMSTSTAHRCQRMVKKCHDDNEEGVKRYLHQLCENMEKSTQDWLIQKNALDRFVEGKPCQLVPEEPQSDGILHGAAAFGFVDVVRCIFLETEFDVNALDKNGWTALMYAALKGFLKTFRVLLTAGGNLNMTADDKTILDLAYEGKNYALIDLVEKRIDAG